MKIFILLTALCGTYLVHARTLNMMQDCTESSLSGMCGPGEVITSIGCAEEFNRCVQVHPDCQDRELLGNCQEGYQPSSYRCSQSQSRCIKIKKTDTVSIFRSDTILKKIESSARNICNNSLGVSSAEAIDVNIYHGYDYEYCPMYAQDMTCPSSVSMSDYFWKVRCFQIHYAKEMNLKFSTIITNN